MDIISVPIITAIVYGFIHLLKSVLKHSVTLETFKSFIPFTAACIGAVLGVTAFYAAPEIMPASNFLVALLIGASSGLAATGCHQMSKQMSGKNKS